MPPLDGSADPTALTAAVFTNGFRPLQAAARATGHLTHPFRHDALPFGAGGPRSAETFLVASRLRRRDAEFEASVGLFLSEVGSGIGALVDETVDDDGGIPLPPVAPLPMALGTALADRRSVRSFTGEPIRLRDLAALAHAAAGTTSPDPHRPFRTAASAGALFPVRLDVVALRVTGVPRGVYTYDSRRHALMPRGDGAAVDGVLDAMAVSRELLMWDRAAVLCLLVARPWRSMRKYGARGMRHVLLEAGAMAAHLDLAATAIGLGSVPCSSVYDDEAHEALGMDGVNEAIVHVVVIGAKE